MIANLRCAGALLVALLVCPKSFGHACICHRRCSPPEAPGAPVTVTWIAPKGRPSLDWIGVFKVGAANLGGPSGTLTGSRVPALVGMFAKTNS